jgi:ABC-type lipoprotein release transport system permease subunit
MCYFTYDSKNSYKLKDDEIILSFGLYKALFGKEYTALTASTFVPHKVKFTRYSDFTDDSTLTFEKEYTIKKVAASSYLNKQGFKELEKARIVPYSLYFDNTSQKEIVYDVSNQNDFLIYTIDTSIVPVINTIIELFRGFCYLIIILLIIVCIVYLISYGIGSIKRNLYEIGVLKALGTKNIDISKIFIFQIIAVGLGVILIAVVGIEVFSSISNKILISAFEDFMTIKIFTLKVIPVKPKIMTFDLVIVFVVTLTSSIIPLIYLKALKPLNILKGNKK